MANSNDYAIVVGVKHYTGLDPLSGPDTDATSFRDWLISPSGGDLLQNNCKLIVSTEQADKPIQHDIDQEFGKILSAFILGNTIGRRLYFYFSGHGLGVSLDDTAMALPPWSPLFRNYALSSSGYLSTLMEGGFFEEVFFFLDCCRNRIPGTSGARPLFGNVKPSAKAATCDSLVCYSTEFDNPSYEAEIVTSKEGVLDNNLVRGLFTVALLNGLRGGAAKNGMVTINGLKDYLGSYLPELANSQNRKQVSRFTFNPSKSDKPITGYIAQTEVEVLLSFTRHPKIVVLEDPNLNILRMDTSDTRPWELMLPIGNYSIRYEEDKASLKWVRIDGTQNPFTYEF